MSTEETRTCRFFLQGICRFGEQCRFVHDASKINQTASLADSADLRVLLETGYGMTHTRLEFGGRDTGVVSGMFCHPDDMTLYSALHVGVPEWTAASENTHMVAEPNSAAALGITQRVSEYFKMTVQGSRLHLFRDASDWMPFYHDSCRQTFTVVVCFGASRDVAFQETTDAHRVITFPVTNGNVFFFSRDVNPLWKHGVPKAVSPSAGCVHLVIWGYTA